jgi:hypothetical protein
MYNGGDTISLIFFQKNTFFANSIFMPYNGRVGVSLIHYKFLRDVADVLFFAEAVSWLQYTELWW